MWNILRFVVVVVVKEAHMTSNIKGMSQLMWAFLKIVVVSSRPNPRMKELPKRERRGTLQRGSGESSEAQL